MKQLKHEIVGKKKTKLIELVSVKERMNKKESEKGQEVTIAFLVGAGSRFPAILKASKKPNSPFAISVVVSHKKESPAGVELARKEGIPAFYFNYVQLKTRLGGKLERREYDQLLGAVLTQTNYSPQGVFMAGWDLVVSENFLNYFERSDGFWNVFNLHPALMTDENLPTYKTSQGLTIPVLRGVDCLEAAWRQKLPVTGVSIHFATPTFDVGPVILRYEIKPDYKNETFEAFAKRFHALEDKALVEAINLFAADKLKIEGGKAEILK